MRKNFEPQKEFLICFDSDGCVIDGMTIKHLECFGPCIIEEWQLQKHRTDILNYWNKINLYSMTRGINRFKGLLMALEYINAADYAKIDILDLKNWIESTTELSNDSLKREMSNKNSEVLNKALRWSMSVNETIEGLPEEKKRPFDGVREALQTASQYADIAVVSSANGRAVEEEWSRNQLLEYVDLVMTQEFGSKIECLKLMLSKGYSNEKVLMVGDAPGDIAAAKENGVLYYPLIVDKEVESWHKFNSTILNAFINSSYKTELMEGCEKEYIKNLSKSE